MEEDSLDKKEQKKNVSNETVDSVKVKIKTDQCNKPEKKKNKKTTNKKNGKVGIKKQNDYAYVKNAPKKVCRKCGSTSHLTHMCKKPKILNNEFAYGYNTPLTQETYSFCDDFDCMSCKIIKFTSCFNMKSKFVEGCISTFEKSKGNHSLNLIQNLLHLILAKFV